MKYYETDSIITRDKLKNNPDVLYLFGDNIERKGYGGQAKEMRGEPNAIGIVTKRYPSNKESSFFTDDLDYDSFREILRSDYLNVINYILINKPRAVVVPPIGVGLADLPNRAPKCYEYLQEMLDNIRSFTEDPSRII